MTVTDEAALNLAIIKLRVSFKEIKAIEVRENEVNIVYKIDEIRDKLEVVMLLPIVLPKVDTIFNKAKIILMRYFEQSEEVIFNKYFFTESGVLDINCNIINHLS